MHIKKISFKRCLLFLILIVVTVSILTYYFSDFLLKKVNKEFENIYNNNRVNLINNAEDFYLNLNNNLNMDDFFFPSFKTSNETFKDLSKNKLISNEVLKDLWIKKENLFNVNLDKASDFFVDKILEQVK